MGKEEIKKNYLEKIKKFRHYNQNYYDKNKSLVADAEFDNLKVEILDLEKKYKFLKNPYQVLDLNHQKIFKK